MNNISFALSLAGLFLVPIFSQDLPGLLDKQLPGLVDTYKGIHARPELSHHEERTSALLATELRKVGYIVTEHVGKYPDGARAYGVVALFENGPGPRLLIRADMDALPIVEETGVSYASHVKTKDASGQDVGVMHACGHDVHVATMIGVGRTMATLKGQWHGTLMLVGQPSEETLDGARALIADSLYERFGSPDFAIALHDTNRRAAGTVSVTSGPAMAGATSVDVVMRGVGGHGSRPDLGKDPIVMSAQFIVQLQTVVSRQEDPRDPAVITIGDIHGGKKRNIIPDEVKMELTARAFSDAARQVILDGIRRTAQGVALSAGVTVDRAPVVTVVDEESVPPLYNDPTLAARVKVILGKALGSENVFDEPPAMSSEDFGLLGLDGHKIPTVMFWLGAIEPAKFSAARAQNKLTPGPHTSRFEPDPELTIRTGVTAMTSVGIALLN